MIIAPHYDDEVIGSGGKIIQTIKKGGEVFVMYVTNSISKNDINKILLPNLGKFILTLNRKIETKIAMTLGGVPLENLFFLDFDAGILEGYKKYPNPELIELIIRIEQDIRKSIEKVRPNEIYIPAYEGGHCDHDLINFIVSRITKELKLKRVYEMPFYPINYPEYMKGDDFAVFQEFIPPDKDQKHIPSFKTMHIDLTEKERKLKHKMLKAYRSQNNYLVTYMSKDDKFRLLPQYDYTKPPHKGELYAKGKLIGNITFDDFRNVIIGLK